MGDKIQNEDWERLEKEFGTPILELVNKVNKINDDMQQILFTLKNPMNKDKGLLADIETIFDKHRDHENRISKLESKIGTKHIILKILGDLGKAVLVAIVAIITTLITTGNLKLP